MKRLLSAMCLLGLFPLTAQSLDSEKLDLYFKTLNDNEQSMVSVAIHKDGELQYANAIGYVNVATKTEANTNSIYRIGSITKTFTSVLTLKQIEEGHLSLDTRLSQFYPQFPSAELITIEMLLRHRSGLRNFTNELDYFDYNTQEMPKEDMLKRLSSYDLDFEPNSKAAYSNSNFVILTYILKEVSGSSYAELLKEDITDPLGLNNTSVSYLMEPAQNEAYSYEYSGEWMQDIETHYTIPLGAGCIQSTPTDLNIFFTAIFEGNLISESSRGQMIDLQDNFGLGIFSFPFGVQRFYGHTGGIDSYRSSSGYNTADGWAVSAITNGGRYNLNDVLIQLLNACYGEEVVIPEFQEEITYTDEELNSFAGAYTNPLVPFKISILKKGKGIMAQAEGQPSFPLESTQKGVFLYKAAGIKIEFKPEENKMIFTQGQSLEFTKEE